MKTMQLSTGPNLIKLTSAATASRRRWASALLLTFVMLGTLIPASAQQRPGAKFGTRDPRSCEDTKSPLKGAISVEQATKYIICDIEKVTGYGHLNLVEDLSVQVGGGVPYDAKTFPYPNIDVKALVYPIRASFKQYDCSPLSDILENTGKNCVIRSVKNATGVCIRTTFGDWQCQVGGSFVAYAKPQYDMPPPKGN
ncbi:MAG: hypothetical protein M3Y69_08240 [Verrucomicrobiota bacterium]|nr:hypothetical protein [Verrucomicrobiota bacterium]